MLDEHYHLKNCWMIIIMKIIEGPMNGTHGHGFPQWFKATTETRPGSPQLLVSLCLPMEKEIRQQDLLIFLGQDILEVFNITKNI